MVLADSHAAFAAETSVAPTPAVIDGASNATDDVAAPKMLQSQVDRLGADMREARSELHEVKEDVRKLGAQMTSASKGIEAVLQALARVQPLGGDQTTQ